MKIAHKRRIQRRALALLLALEALALAWGFGQGRLQPDATTLLSIALATLGVYNATLIGVSIWAARRRARRPGRTL